MDKCPRCERKTIPKYKKYLTGPASETSCEECGAFIMLSREAYVIIALFAILLIPVYLLNAYLGDSNVIQILLNFSYVLGFVYVYEKNVRWLIDPNMYN